MTAGRKQLILNKGIQKFIFRYDRGGEEYLLDAVIEQAESPRTDFDWFDAAVLSHKLAERLIGEADEILGGRHTGTA